MAQTIITIGSTGQNFNIPGTKNASQIVSDFADAVPGIASMNVSTVVNEAGDTVHTFSQRTGTKGAAETNIVISTTGQNFKIPGTKSAAQIVSDFADAVPGIASMNVESATAGDVTTHTFSARTGTKGDC